MQWADNGWLTSHKTSTQEIGNLLAIVERDLKDAIEGGISADWRFGIAYNAALKLCTVLLYAEGYKAERTMRIIWTHAALKETSWSMIISEALQKTMRMSLLTL